MAKINLKALAKRAYESNSLLAYIRLGELIEMGLIVQHSICRHGVVEVSLTEKGQAFLVQVSSESDIDTPDSLRHLHDDADLMGLLELCRTGNLDQTQETVQENP